MAETLDRRVHPTAMWPQVKSAVVVGMSYGPDSNPLDGLARGTIGWPDYPHRTPSTLDFTTRQRPGYWFQPRWPEVWFPDAFVGTMAQLLCALEDGTEPAISGRDNLETVALCEAVLAAAREHRVTTVREFAGFGTPGSPSLTRG